MVITAPQDGRYKNTPGVNAPVAPAIITTAAAFEPASNFNAMQIASAKVTTIA